MTSRPHFLQEGPPLPLVPPGYFKPIKFTREEWEMVWTLIGPSIERNQHKPMAPWRLYAFCFIEGMRFSLAVQPATEATEATGATSEHKSSSLDIQDNWEW